MDRYTRCKCGNPLVSHTEIIAGQCWECAGNLAYEKELKRRKEMVGLIPKPLTKEE